MVCDQGFRGLRGAWRNECGRAQAESDVYDPAAGLAVTQAIKSGGPKRVSWATSSASAELRNTPRATRKPGGGIGEQGLNFDGSGIGRFTRRLFVWRVLASRSRVVAEPTPACGVPWNDTTRPACSFSV